MYGTSDFIQVGLSQAADQLSAVPPPHNHEVRYEPRLGVRPVPNWTRVCLYVGGHSGRGAQPEAWRMAQVTLSRLNRLKSPVLCPGCKGLILSRDGLATGWFCANCGAGRAYICIHVEGRHNRRSPRFGEWHS